MTIEKLEQEIITLEQQGKDKTKYYNDKAESWKKKFEQQAIDFKTK